MEDNNTENRKICKSCGASKLLRDYIKCKTCQGGYTPRCRHCMSSNTEIFKNKTVKKRESQDNLSMYGIGKDTYIEMYEFFERIGYDLTRPIAEQFAEKHNLEVKKRQSHKLNRYDPESLGLI
jgi:hypothetical protein